MSIPERERTLAVQMSDTDEVTQAAFTNVPRMDLMVVTPVGCSVGAVSFMTLSVILGVALTEEEKIFGTLGAAFVGGIVFGFITNLTNMVTEAIYSRE